MAFLIFFSLSIVSFTNELSAPNQQVASIEQNAFNNTMLYIFTGSDWCADCRRLKKNILNDSIFLDAMETNNIAIEIIDFPQRKKLSPELIKHNESIAETYNFQGVFPTLVLSESENEFETLAYNNQNASEFSALILEKLKYLNE